MKTKLKKILIPTTFFIIIILLYLITKLNTRTLYNTTSITGNTAGNLYNGGLFCKYNGIIYFSNNSDDGALYSMNTSFSNVKKLNKDKPYYLNVDENYIYYCRANYTQKRENASVFNFYSYGLYRTNKKGTSLKTLSSKLSGSAALYGNYIYYQQYEKGVGLFLYQVKIDGNENKLLSKVNIEPFSYKDGMLYYTPGSSSDNHYIHTLNLEDQMDSILYEGNCSMPIAATSGIFYVSLADGYSICRLNYDTLEKEILVNEFCAFYNISDDEQTIYFQIDGGDHNRIAKYDLTTMTQETIMDGNYKNIHVIGNYVFFRDFDEKNTYLYNSSDGSVSIFKAPVIEKK